ncbi:MAG: molybdenum cofactor guanylyltransferase [Burkholderiaceae bacterium]|nr:molybdenum cofactor guanylyltransferase [Burkholderiaceae bacterium]
MARSAAPARLQSPTRDTITGIVLAGGRGSRMGGIDKGLVPWHGRPLARHALERLAPQVRASAISANRHAPTYASWGVAVWPDTLTGFHGPLAGLLTAMVQARTTWVCTVPCDSPRFPADLVARLTRAATENAAPLALAATRDASGRLQAEPAFCLAHVGLRIALEQFLLGGGRRVREWAESEGAVLVPFDLSHDDPQAFANANTAADLANLASLSDAR